MANKKGKNQYDNGKKPPDHLLAKALHEYARKGFTLEERLDRLGKDFDYFVKIRTLKKLNQKFQVPTVKKPPPTPISTTIVCKYINANLTSGNGPATIQRRIAQLEGVLIPCDTVRTIMLLNDPDGFNIRNPTRKVKPRRKGHLVGYGVFQEIHCDGHEKLNHKALQLGGVGIDIYGMKCHGSGQIIEEFVVPNARCEYTVAHCYLDMVEAYGEIPEQLTVDGGTETGQMRACHIALRNIYAPELSFETHPPFVALKSSDNVPIESSWENLRKYNGRDLKEAILMTKDADKRYFNPLNPVHINLFNWVWPKVTHVSVQEFKEYWNNHCVRNQPNKILPSGVRPTAVFDFPEHYGLKHCGIKVDKEVVRHLRNQLEKSREECFSWVSDEFNLKAQEAYEKLGSPKFEIVSGWTLFCEMLPLVQ
ncbi:hypothetical protein K435DRAFT_679314 [Dendrothele bispora CBS 962.96]|uniref:Integrase catalytic domain-containing protein n=1 Tax=Dendrothele bispora (strain CBS 962.96) TaxID=1314807 RepID=A0A4S8LJB6_DENBC|nr:hypothetical protein K435DRAFT_679314 [Dendrothele bispora CBS 962.96]